MLICETEISKGLISYCIDLKSASGQAAFSIAQSSQLFASKRLLTFGRRLLFQFVIISLALFIKVEMPSEPTEGQILAIPWP